MDVLKRATIKDMDVLKCAPIKDMDVLKRAPIKDITFPKCDNYLGLTVCNAVASSSPKISEYPPCIVYI